MRISLLFAFLLLVGFFSLVILRVRSAGSQVAQLTANELADAMDIHWWVVKIPADLGPKDKVEYHFISSDGKEVAGGCAFSPGSANISLGSSVRLFCWEDKAAQQMVVKFEANGGVGTGYTQDYFHAASVFSGGGNGTVFQPGDILMKFDSSKTPNFDDGNVLLPGQIGLQIVVKKAGS